MLIVNNLQATQVLPPDSSSKVFDDACGIGSVTAEVKKSFPDIPVLAIDSSAGMLKVFDRKVKKHDLKNVEARLLDGGNLTGIPPTTINLFPPSSPLHSLSWCQKKKSSTLRPRG